MPTEYSDRWGTGRLVWREEGVLHGFVLMETTAREFEEIFIKASKNGAKNALRDSKQFARMAEHGH